MTSTTRPAPETPAEESAARAIARSVSHNEIVTITVHTRDDYDATCAALDEQSDGDVATGNGQWNYGAHEFWAASDDEEDDPDGMAWRVHVVLV